MLGAGRPASANTLTKDLAVIGITAVAATRRTDTKTQLPEECVNADGVLNIAAPVFITWCCTVATREAVQHLGEAKV